MKALVVNQSEVHELLPMHECMEVMAEALMALSRGDALNPLRHVLRLPDGAGAMVTMPVYVGNINAMGLKVISVMPGNEGTEYDSHQGTVVLFETAHGRLIAVVDASSITAIRTAAVSGVATKLLARADAGNLAILGSGVQAQAHLEAMLIAREIRRVRVWSRTRENAMRYTSQLSRRHGIRIEPVETARDAVEGADIICTTTASPEPILIGDWIGPGTHINAVGSSVPFARELDTRAVVMSRLFVDRRESTLNEAGDFLFPKKEGAIGDEHILGEIGEILLGKIKGRESPGDITLFKSLGLAIEDVAAAYHVYQTAVEKGVGTWVEVGGLRQVFS